MVSPIITFLPLSFWADWLTLNILLDGNALESHVCPRQGHKLLESLPFSPRISLDYSSSGMFVDPILELISLNFPIE